jgi:hypothetical protein
MKDVGVLRTPLHPYILASWSQAVGRQDIMRFTHHEARPREDERR